jgi:integrase
LAWVEKNPLNDIRKPSASPHREQLIDWREIKAVLRVLGYSKKIKSVSGSVAIAFMLALRTGMRAGEICALHWCDYDSNNCVLRLHTSKTGVGRDIPLSPKAVRVLKRADGWSTGSILELEPRTLDALFRRAKKKVGLEGFTFHDSRHVAATMLSAYFDTLSLCKAFGWKSTTRALTYYNPTGKDLASMLERGQRARRS